jgi:hypothetical protein
MILNDDPEGFEMGLGCCLLEHEPEYSICSTELNVLYYYYYYYLQTLSIDVQQHGTQKVKFARGNRF